MRWREEKKSSIRVEKDLLKKGGGEIGLKNRENLGEREGDT